MAGGEDHTPATPPSGGDDGAAAAGLAGGGLLRVDLEAVARELGVGSAAALLDALAVEPDDPPPVEGGQADGGWTDGVHPWAGDNGPPAAWLDDEEGEGADAEEGAGGGVHAEEGAGGGGARGGGLPRAAPW